VVVAGPELRPVAAFERDGDILEVSPSRLAEPPPTDRTPLQH
jgi:hypothetical protein